MILRWFFLLALLFFAGCTTLPNDEELILKNHIPKTFNHQIALKELKEKGIIKGDYLESFFHLFPDPSLQKLILESLKSNTNLLTLESKIIQAKSTARINTAAMIPSVSVGSSYNSSNQNYKNVSVNYNQNSLNANASLSWEIDIFGRLNALRKASIQNYLATKDSLESAKISLIADIANYYFTIRQLQNSIQIQTKIIQNFEQIMQITESKYKIGLIDITDLSTIKNSLTSQKNALLTLQYNLEQNKNALNVLLNVQNNPIEIEQISPLSPAQIPLIDALPQKALILRPDVQNAIHTLYASLYTRTSKKMALLPSITISGNLGQLLFSNTAHSGGLISQITSSLTMPLFNRQSLTQSYLMAKEDTKQAYYTLQNTINTAISELNNAAINLKTSKQSYENAKENLKYLYKSLMSAKAQYEERLIDEQSYYENQNTYLSAENSLLADSLNLNQALIAIYKALAGNLSKENHQNTLKETK